MKNDGFICIKALAGSVSDPFIGSICCFLFIRLLPGGPVAAIYGEQYQKVSDAEWIRIVDNLGLNKPLPAQYISWLTDAVQGKWGSSSSTREDITEVIGRTLQPTFLLLLSSQLLLFLHFGASTLI